LIVEISSIGQDHCEEIVPARSLGFNCTEVKIVHSPRIISDLAGEPHIAAANVGKKGETNASS